MDDKLKKFISTHRPEFDSIHPSVDLFKEIDSRIVIKDSQRISSEWLSKFKYLAFGTSVLIAVLYIIFENSGNSTLKGIYPDKTDSINNVWIKRNEANKYSERVSSEQTDISKVTKTLSDNESGASIKKQLKNGELINGLLQNKADDLVSEAPSRITSDIHEKKDKTVDHIDSIKKKTEKKERSPNAGKDESLTRKNKIQEIYIPEEPLKTNSYTATLYKNTSFCALLRAYTFPGQLNQENGKGISRRDEGSKPTVKIVSCSRLENIPGLKAIWVKGKTVEEITLTIKKRFKNIVLLKNDGRKLRPEAISHYYPGLGVISEYSGKYFNMVFKNRVELILFFTDVSEGDKIIIDGIIEADVVNQP